MDDGVEMLSARIPSELKRLVDADTRTNQQVVEAALWREFGGERKASIDRRIEEKKNRMSVIEREKNERERELEQEKEELKALKAKRSKIEEQTDEELQSVIRKCQNVPANPENGFIREWADDVDMSAEELAHEVAETYDKEYQEPDDNDFRSI